MNPGFFVKNVMAFYNCQMEIDLGSHREQLQKNEKI